VYRRPDAGVVENILGGITDVDATSSVEKGASRAESIMAASENPKYRIEAMKTADEAGGVAIVESLIQDGAHVGVYVSKSRCLLTIPPSPSTPPSLSWRCPCAHSFSTSLFL
jgi:hypothetical protein